MSKAYTHRIFTVQDGWVWRIWATPKTPSMMNDGDYISNLIARLWQSAALAICDTVSFLLTIIPWVISLVDGGSQGATWMIGMIFQKDPSLVGLEDWQYIKNFGWFKRMMELIIGITGQRWFTVTVDSQAGIILSVHILSPVNLYWYISYRFSCGKQEICPHLYLHKYHPRFFSNWVPVNHLLCQWINECSTEPSYTIISYN